MSLEGNYFFYLYKKITLLVMNRRKKKKTDVLSIAILLVKLCLFFILIILIISNIRIYQRREKIQTHIYEKEARIRELEERDGWADYLKNDNDFMMEKIAREQLLLKRAGEEVVFIPLSDTQEKEDKEKEKYYWWNPLGWKELLIDLF